MFGLPDILIIEGCVFYNTYIGGIKMKCFKLKALVSLLLILSMLVLTSCGGSNEKATDSSSNEKQDTQNVAKETETKKEEEQAKEEKTEFDPMAKYDPAIEVTSVKIIPDGLQFAEGEDFENNIWTRGYEEELGIKVKYLWTVPAAQGEQKMNVAIASNDLPDITPVNMRQFKQLVDTGVAMDITKLVEDYTTPFTKEMLQSDNGAGLQQVTVDGKIMGLPNIGGNIDGASMIWIRADWLKNLGLEPPKTMDDVIKIADAFTNNDPDKNGKNDTHGLAVNKDLFGGLAVLNGFFEGYHAYPTGWIQDSSGNLVYGGIQPEVKEALAKLAEMYKAGYIDQEFAVKDAAKVAEDLAAGKVGLMYGQHWVTFWPLQSTIDNNPEADWKPYPIVSVDDKPAKPMIGGSAGTVYVVNQDMKNPEAAIKLYNYYYAKDCALSDQFDPEFHADDTRKYNRYQYAVMQSFYGEQNIFIHRNVKKYLETKDESILANYWVKDNVQQIQKYLDGDKTYWGGYAWSGPEGAFSVIDYYDNNDLFLLNGYIKADTPTTVEKGATLGKMQAETFTKIIMGTVSIDEFDKYVEDWKRLGGDDITKEVNEAK